MPYRQQTLPERQGRQGRTVAALVDNTGGTADPTAIANLASGSVYATDFADLENNLATLSAKVNELIVVVGDPH